MRHAAALALVALALAPAGCSHNSPPAAAPSSAAAAHAPAPGQPVEARRKALDALLREHWEWVLERSPELASILGDLRYNDRWSDRSAEAIAADIEKRVAFLARFEAIDTAGFPAQEALSRDLMVRDLREAVEGARFEDWLMPVNQVSGVHIELPRLVPLLRFAAVKDYDDYAARLRAVPQVFDQAIALMRTGVEKKLVPPRFLLERAVGQAEALARNKPEASPFAQPVARFPDAIPAAEQGRLRAEVLGAVREQVLPAYRKLAVFLRDEYVPHGRSHVGVWSLPDGAARYAFEVKSQTTTDMTAEEIHEIGLREVARIEAEQEAIGKKLGFADLAAFRGHVRGNKKLFARSRKDILERYQTYTDRMYKVLPRLFGRLPRQKMLILPVEEFREKEFSGAEYEQGTPDGSRPGMVRVNTGDATKRLTIEMESTAYHEGVPGHHMQIAIQQELSDLPPFRQQARYTAFIEGWALYSERLGKEVGFYSDPYNDYGRLQDEMLRAIRLVVDTGLHSKKWTRDQVVAFFHDHSTISEPDVQAETDRYIVWPGQALAYKVGQITITRLRERAKSELGERFDVRAFHDEVLGAGALPLQTLEARIDHWIERVKSARR
jgi:uncharacterized protein (DUF885 family)